MTACRWNAEAKDYLTLDGDLCRRDVDGWPTKHCTAKRTCSQHVAASELTCGRCINDVRSNLRWIPDLAPLVMVEALDDGVNSEAAWLSGPASDYRVFSARRALNRRWLLEHIPDRNLERAMTALLDDDDELHPYSVLTRWHLMLAEDYGHPLPNRMTLADSAAYLDRNLHRLAQDEAQDFPLFRREIRKVREHLEAVIHNSTRAERGLPCPECKELGLPPERLHRHYGHWCTAEDCTKLHFLDDSADEWVCPRDRRHRWSHRAYESWLEERTGGRSA